MARVLLECKNALVALDRVEALEAAGHLVDTCNGPGSGDCPVVRGQPCAKVADADLVISCLGDRTLRVTLATKLTHPDKSIVAVLTEEEVSDVVQAVIGLDLVPTGIDDESLARAVDAAVEGRS